MNFVKLRKAFRTHKGGAAKRGIAFELTFEEWLNIWLDSGHLAERGTHRGQYCMARFGDKGPYAVENIKIITCTENVKEGMIGKQNALGSIRSDEQRVEHSQFMMGNQYGLGWVPSDTQRAENSQRMMGKQNALGSIRSDEWCAELSRRQTGKKRGPYRKKGRLE